LSTFLTSGWRSCMRDLRRSSSLKAMESYTSRHFSRIWRKTWSTFQGVTSGWRSCLRDLGRSSLKAMESYNWRPTFLKNMEIPINKLEPFVSYRYLLLLFIPGQRPLNRVRHLNDSMHTPPAGQSHCSSTIPGSTPMFPVSHVGSAAGA